MAAVRFCPTPVTGECSEYRGSTSLDFLYGPTTKPCIIEALWAPHWELY